MQNSSAERREVRQFHRYIYTLCKLTVSHMSTVQIWYLVNSQSNRRKFIHIQRQIMTDKTEVHEDVNQDVRGEANQMVDWHKLVGSHSYWSTSR